MYICGIHTDAGKTHLAAVMVKAFNLGYFKLVQAGSERDADVVRSFVGEGARIYDDGKFFKTPASPHLCAQLEGEEFCASDIVLPPKGVVIETAGGVFCPIDQTSTMIDFIASNPRAVVLAARYYLGCINHTIASVQALRARGIELAAVVMIGKSEPSTDEFISRYCGVNLAQLPEFSVANFDEVAQEFRANYPELGSL